MITFFCAACGKELEAGDDQAGGQVTCACGASTMIPVELELGEGSVSPDAKTMTPSEVRALRQKDA
jgi:hypothetical protein